MHADERWQAFSERVTYQAHPHVSVEVFTPTPDAIARLNERNAHVLRSLATLDERRADGADDNDPLMQELQRMDSKLNVLLDIVDRLLVPVAALPQRQAVNLNPVGVVLPQNVILAGADTLLVRVHFDRCRALPLELPARFGRSLNDGNAFVYFCGLSDMVEDELERFVFCHHRRKVAEARLQSAAENVSDSKRGV